MTDTNTETAQLAREWAQTTQPKGDAKTRAAIEHIMATTPQTMADVVWDDEKHTLAGATLDIGHGPQNVTMTGRHGSIIYYITEDGRADYAYRSELTPNGKKYKLAEVTEPEHPETLSTVEDYEDAPEGTIIANPGDMPWIKEDGHWRSPIFRQSSESLALTVVGNDRPVLRWGENGKA